MTDSIEYRIEKALALAPAVPSLIVILLLLIFGVDNNYIWSIAAVSCWVVSYLSTVLIGWPIFNMLKRTNQLNLFTLSLMGMLAGSLVLTLLMSLFDTDNFVLTLLWGAGFGLLIALSFGIIAGVKAFDQSK